MGKSTMERAQGWRYFLSTKRNWQMIEEEITACEWQDTSQSSYCSLTTRCNRMKMTSRTQFKLRELVIALSKVFSTNLVSGYRASLMHNSCNWFSTEKYRQVLAAASWRRYRSYYMILIVQLPRSRKHKIWLSAMERTQGWIFFYH